MVVIVLVIAARILVRRALVDGEVDAFDLLPLRTIEVHVEIADLHFR